MQTPVYRVMTLLCAVVGALPIGTNLGLVARIGSVGEQRLGLPVVIERADPADPSPGALLRGLLARAAGVLEADEVLVTDREFRVSQLQAAKVPAWLTRLTRNSTARRASPPDYPGRGRPATRGAVVRPLARRWQGRLIPATPPDETETWQDGATEVRAAVWRDLVLPDAAPDSPPFRIVAIRPERSRRTRATPRRCCWQRRWRCRRARWASCIGTAGS